MRSRGTVESIAPVKGRAFEITTRVGTVVEYIVLHGDTLVHVQRGHVMRVAADTIAEISETIKRAIGPRIPRRGKPIVIHGEARIVEDIDRADRMVKAGGRWFEFSEIG